MKFSYEDRILENTSEEIHHNALVRRVKGDKTGIGKAIQGLINDGSLNMRKEKNQKIYKRNDTISSEDAFNRLMKMEQWNYDQINNVIKKIPKLTTKTGRVSKRGKYIIRHLEYLTNRSMILVVRTNFQKNLGLISNKIAQRRIRIINEIMSENMENVTTKYKSEIKLVRELFQNHSKELKFKI